jgi:hypothetical protein
MESTRDLVCSRANGRCEYCHLPEALAGATFHVEHIRPRSRGGRTKPPNLAYACPPCNEHKASRTEGADPTTGRLAPLFHPRRDRWAQHFTWSDDHRRLIGRSATGRATVEVLALNAMARQELRALWWHRLRDILPFG